MTSAQCADLLPGAGEPGQPGGRLRPAQGAESRLEEHVVTLLQGALYHIAGRAVSEISRKFSQYSVKIVQVNYGNYDMYLSVNHRSVVWLGKTILIKAAHHSIKD